MSQPERMGPYTITGVIGEGSMGVVYRGFDPLIERPVAIKTIRKALLDDHDGGASAAARFKIEAQAAGRLNHPGIVSVYQFGEDNECAFIAMEFVEGRSLREYIVRRVPFSEQDVLSIMMQLLDALDYAHDRGVLHRDIKPANLIVARSGTLKITDFGIARIESANVTRVNAVIGSPGYMAPEQYTGEPVDRRVDVFSSGVLLYQLMTGKLPFTGSDDQVMYKIVYEDPVPPSQLPGNERWAAYDQIVMTALAKRADQRFQSARKFRDALLALAAQPVAPTVSEETLFLTPVPSDPRNLPGSRVIAGTHQLGAAFTSVSAAGSMPAPTGWDDKQLSTVERELARYIGPVAKVLVRRAAKDCADVDTLRATVAQHIRSPDEQTQFLSATRVRMATSPGRASAAAAPTTLQRGPVGTATVPTAQLLSTPITAEALAHATKVLTRHVGPIGGVLVKKTASTAPDLQTLHAKLAEKVAGQVDARRVLQELAAAR